MSINKTLYLASSSPRRQELVRMLGLPYEVRVSDADESTEPALSPASIVAALAMRKALAVLQCGVPAPGVILGADTIVVVDGTVLGKPRDENDAVRMLTALQGRTHEVFSGVACVDADYSGNPAAMEKATHLNADHLDNAVVQTIPGADSTFAIGGLASYRILAEADGQAEVLSGYSFSKVTFRPMSEREIRAYVATGEPMDKAGAYAVQGIGAVSIEKIEGDFFSIMGLPLNLLYPMLQKLGISIWR
ncbi:Maf family protein [Gorillibacterium timonense]|uniref:Maf family protein n=1 Tax=Gorillibacterium timonense TaxID=1689269 RepID=UPI00071DF803|nr:Maf family protein [Gorillibacterium timonense]